MNTDANQTQQNLPKVDWTKVRPIYKKLSDEFQSLTTPFGFQLSEYSKIHLDHLIIAIDAVDDVLDEVKTKENRDELSRQMVNFLRGDDALLQNKEGTRDLFKSLVNLRKIVRASSSTEQFVNSAEQIFLNTESKRHVTNKETLLEYIQLEGLATAGMPLSLMAGQSTPKFREFFSRLCQLMGIVDLIFDAKDDYKTNKISLPPSLSLYISLIRITINSGIAILKLAPKKWAFIKYCFRFGMTLLKGG